MLEDCGVFSSPQNTRWISVALTMRPLLIKGLISNIWSHLVNLTAILQVPLITPLTPASVK